MLVEYSSSSEDEEYVTPPDKSLNKSCFGGKKDVEVKSVPPLPSVPAGILNMFSASGDGPVDDQDQHGGRTRTFQHERGNWATHVYIPFSPPDDFDEFLTGLLGCLDCGWQPVDDFHISLSRTFPIRYHWMEGLFQTLKSSLRMRRFGMSFHGCKIYVNDERTRSFLGVNVRAGAQHLRTLVGQVDAALSEYKLPLYYESPEFHLSLVWRLGDASQTSPEKQEKLESYLSSTLDDLSFHTDQAVMKSGNRFYNLPFS